MLCYAFSNLELNSSIDGLMQVNATVGRLLASTQRLQMELGNLTDQVEQLRSDCNAASLTVCGRIPVITYTVNVNYNVVRICMHYMVYQCYHNMNYSIAQNVLVFIFCVKFQNRIIVSKY